MADFQLLCDRCRGQLEEFAGEPMQLVATVKRSAVKGDLFIHPHQVSRRCRGCSFVNIFIPLREYEALVRL